MTLTETKLRRIIRNFISEYGRRPQERKQHWVIVCDWTSHKDPSKHKNGEQVYAEYFGTETNAKRKALQYQREVGAFMKIESSVEDRIYGESLSRFGDVRNFLQTVIWPCYQSGLSERECYRQALGTEEMQFLRKHQEDILSVNDNPEFIAYAYEIACMV